MFRTLTYSDPEAYSKPRKICTIECFTKLVKSYNCFRNITFSCSLLCEIAKYHEFFKYRSNLYSRCIYSMQKSIGAEKAGCLEF